MSKPLTTDNQFQMFDRLNERLRRLELGIGKIDMVTTLPTTPDNDTVVRFPADTDGDGVEWMFAYNADSTSAYKWEFVGGVPLTGETTAGEASSSTSYTNLATTGPSVVLPLDGDYLVQIGCESWNNTANANSYMSYAIGGTGAVDNDAFRSRQNSAGNTGVAAATRLMRKTGLTAVTLTAKYRVDAGTGTWANRWIAVTPIRVG